MKLHENLAVVDRAWRALVRNPPSPAAFGFAAIDDHPEPLRQLDETERAVFQSFPTEKRRRDWLLGRRAAKRALSARLALNPADIGVRNDAQGAPFAQAEGRSLPLSITHSRGEAFAMHALEDAFGLDLEALAPRPRRSLRFYLQADERPPFDVLEGPDFDRAAIAAWCLKEAAFKALRPARGAALIDVRIVQGPEAYLTGEVRLRFSGALDERRRALGLASEARARVIDRGASLLAVLRVPPAS